MTMNEQATRYAQCTLLAPDPEGYFEWAFTNLTTMHLDESAEQLFNWWASHPKNPNAII